MTLTEIKTMAETLVDDVIDETISLQLLNDKIQEIYSERPWTFLIAVDETQHTSAGNLWEQSFVLPSDCDSIIKIEINGKEYTPRPYSDYDACKTINHYYFISNALYLSGAIDASYPIRITYKKSANDLALNDAPLFPSRFHKMLAYYLAADFYMIDAGEKGMSWHNEWYVKGETKLNQMRLWDAEQQTKALNTKLKEKTNIY